MALKLKIQRIWNKWIKFPKELYIWVFGFFLASGCRVEELPKISIGLSYKWVSAYTLKSHMVALGLPRHSLQMQSAFKMLNPIPFTTVTEKEHFWVLAAKQEHRRQLAACRAERSMGCCSTEREGKAVRLVPEAQSEKNIIVTNWIQEDDNASA